MFDKPEEIENFNLSPKIVELAQRYISYDKKGGKFNF